MTITSIQAAEQSAARNIMAALSILLLAATIALGSTAPARATTIPPELVVEAWTRQTTHPLVGRIWIARDDRVIDGPALSRGIIVGFPIVDAIGAKPGQLLLLGEIHDNPEHHLFRAGLIDAVTGPSAFGRAAHPAIVAEHIRADQSPALEAFARPSTASANQRAEHLFELLEWQRSGWPDARIFQPLYTAIIEARLPILPGDTPRERIRALARGGITALDWTEAARLGLARDWPASLADALATELKGSHCGMLPDAAIPGMSFAQRFRDAHLADAMLTAADRHDGAILLAGNGHIRTDRGVPWYLRIRETSRPILSIMLAEVEDGSTAPSAYAPRDPAGNPAIDVIVFTPRAKREDPCEKMREHMKKAK
jgi:uncharacterized iron-regulated protein